MKKIFIALVLLLLAQVSYTQQVPAGFILEELVGGLNPTTMALAPDGRLFIAEKDGAVLVVENGTLQSQPFLSVEVDNFNERGLSGIAFDPEFELNNFFYVYYTVPNENRNRLSRFTANGDFAIPGSEQVLLELDPLSGTIHNGGAMNFGLDGKLYLAVGDGANANDAQNLNSLAGKVLRLNSDGSIPEDNPFYNDLSGVYRSIYALGLRNPFTFSIQQGTGQILVNDVGQASFEEVNEIVAGANYGWPGVEGFIGTQTPPQNYQDPLHAYDHNVGCAIIGSAFYNPPNQTFPVEYHGKYFFADYCGGYINVLNPATGDVEQTFATDINRPLAFVFTEEGNMFYLERAGQGGGSQGDNTGTEDGALWQVIYTGSGAPFIGRQPQSVLVPVGEDVSFSVNASGQPVLSYQWRRNGVDISGAISETFVFTSVDLSNNGDVFTCLVTNGEGSVISDGAVLSVTTNTRPNPQIATPDDNMMYRAGETINYQGMAMDAEDGQLPETQLTWRIDFHHDDHTHPALASTSGINGGAFQVPRIGETSDNVWYRVYLTAQDNEGLTQTVSRDIFPNKSDLLVNSDPVGLSINLDGQSVNTPFNFTGVEGITRTLEAPRLQTVDGVNYIFDRWNDGSTNPLISFNTPMADSLISARYLVFEQDNGQGLTGEYFAEAFQDFPATPTFVRLDPTIDFNWGLEGPATNIGVDNFTVRWTGMITPIVEGLYTFSTQSDDGVRLWVDEELIIDRWVPQAITEWSGTKFLNTGQQYSIRMEYFEAGGDAEVRLLWSSDIISKQVIPTSQLFPNQVVGISDNIDDEIKVYPNPANNKAAIFSPVTVEEVSLITLSGAQKMSFNPQRSENITVDLSEVKAGLYLLYVRTSRGVFIEKLIVE